MVQAVSGLALSRQPVGRFPRIDGVFAILPFVSVVPERLAPEAEGLSVKAESLASAAETLAALDEKLAAPVEGFSSLGESPSSVAERAWNQPNLFNPEWDRAGVSPR